MVGDGLFFNGYVCFREGRSQHIGLTSDKSWQSISDHFVKIIQKNEMGKNTHTLHGTGIFTYVSLVDFMVNIDKYTIHVSLPGFLFETKIVSCQ